MIKIVKNIKNLFSKGDSMDNIGKAVEAAGDVIKSGSAKEQGTVRHQNDMLSDSFLSKNIRPMVLIWFIILFTIGFVGKIAGWKVDASMMQTLGTLLIMAVGFYFPMRSAEKYMRNRVKKL